MVEADFSGYATRNGVRCSDGRTIIADAFKHQDQVRVPLVWQHQHNMPQNVLGHAILENREDGVYCQCFFNTTENAQIAKDLVRHEDITALSIYASGLTQQGKNVVHGNITEVSLVVSGANPEALIDNVNLQHSGSLELLDDEAIIYTGLTLEHSMKEGTSVADTDEKTIQDVFDTFTEEQEAVVHHMLGEALAHARDEDLEHAEGDDEGDDDEGDDKTVADVFDAFTEEQKNVVYFMIGEAMDAKDDTPAADDAEHSNNSDSLQHSQEGTPMSRNVFEQNGPAAAKATLTHSQIREILDDAEKMGSIKESFLAHAGDYGIDNIDLLFPDARATSASPELLARQAEWVPKVLAATKHAPFAKIKSLVADLTAEEARAKGYIKGKMKKEEVFGLLRRTTSPTTVYKKQKLDRDDLLDITDFDVIAWLKWEIRFMLNEELARAILVGDGRSTISDDKVKDPAGSNDGSGIRSIANDHDMYAHKVQLAANVSASVIVDEVSRARTHYRGSGTPTWYTTDKTLTDLLLLKDKMGRRLYETEAALAAALRVKEIVSVEVMEETPDLLGIMVNLTDYTIGANKGGELSFFEDFDIDFNQNKYLMETRVSGALTKPKSAIVIRRAIGTAATPAAPSFNGTTNTITIPTTAGIEYMIDEVIVTGDVVIDKDTEVVATAAAGSYIPANTTASWTFTFTA